MAPPLLSLSSSSLSLLLLSLLEALEEKEPTMARSMKLSLTKMYFMSEEARDMPRGRDPGRPLSPVSSMLWMQCWRTSPHSRRR